MASVKDKRKAAGTGGGKRSSSKATYSKNKTVGRDTIPQVEKAYSELTDNQKLAASSLGLSKEQATQVNERQADLINANVGSYDETKKQQLKTMYSNVTADRLIRSGNSGLSKIAVQEYKQSVQQKAAGTSVAVKEAQKVIQRGAAESRATQLKSFNTETKKWEVSTQTLRNLSSTKIRTQGDWTAINNVATRNTLFGSNAAEKERIQLARNYVIKNSSNPEKTRRAIEYNEMLAAAKTPITGSTSYEQTKDINAARQKMLFEFSTIPVSGAKKGKVYKENVQAYFDWIDKQSFGTAQKMTVKKYMATHAFRTVDQQKQDVMDKDLKEFAEESAVKGFIADLYKVTSTKENLKSGEMSTTDKRLTGWLPSRDSIALKRDIALQKAGLLKMQRKQQAYVKNDPALGSLLTWTENKYDAVRTKPASVGVDVAKFAAEAVFLGAAFKGVGVVGGKILSKSGALGYKVSPKFAKKAAEKAGSIKSKIPVVRKVTAKNLPEVAMGGYFGEQIARAGVGGARIKNEKTGKYTSLREGNGSVYKKLYAAKKSGKNVQWVTEENIDLGAKLTAALPFFAAGARIGKISLHPPASIKAQGKTLATNFGKNVRDPTYTKKVEAPKRTLATLKGKNVRNPAIAAQKKKIEFDKYIAALRRKDFRKLTEEEAIDLGKANRETIAARKSVKEEKQMFKTLGRLLSDEDAIMSMTGPKSIGPRAISVPMPKSTVMSKAKTALQGSKSVRSKAITSLPKAKPEVVQKVKTKLQQMKNVRFKTRQKMPKAKQQPQNKQAQEFRLRILEKLKTSALSKVQLKELSMLMTRLDIQSLQEIANRVDVASMQALKQDIQQAVKQAAATKQKTKTAQETKQVVKPKPRARPRARTKAKPKKEGKPKVETKLPILIPLLRRKKGAKKVKATTRKYKRAHRVTKSTLGSLSSMFGDSEVTTRRKPSKPARKTKQRKR